jgi:ABC-type branched-subunit amino acid transport system ATPase component/branched-subunit amino acid ABC-type transport system permease component
MDMVQFALLGLGVGTAYVLIGQGIVLIYRGSGVLNFAQGALAMVTAEIFYALPRGHGMPTPVALLIALGSAGLLGAMMGYVTVRLLATASALARLIGTLGFLAIAQGTASVLWANDNRAVNGLFPTWLIHLGSGIAITADRLCAAGLGLLLTAVLWWVYQRTRYGLATSAVAENQQAAELLGWSPTVVGTANWAIGSVLAGVAGIVLSPIAGLSSGILVLTVIPGLAAALVGQFSSFWLTLAGGMGIGVIQSEMARFVQAQGWADAVPFLIIIALVVARGRALPLRDDVLDRPMRVGSGRVRPAWLITLCVAAAVIFSRGGYDWQLALTTSALMGIVGLSLVLITGYAGQISLAQLTLAGVGALAAANLAVRWHAPFVLSVLGGTVAAAAVGVLVGLPALRCRGVNLAVVTIGLSLVIEELVLGNAALTGGYAGFQMPAPSLFGYSFASIQYPARYALLVAGAFIGCALLLAGIRRSFVGRALLAVRSNERAATCAGVNVTGAKLLAFGLASALAGFSGALAVYQFPQLSLTPYTTVGSIDLLVTTVIGGIGYFGGALAGGIASPGGVMGQLLSALNGSLTNYLALIGGIAVIKILIFCPDGLSDLLARRLPRSRRARRRAVPRQADGELPALPGRCGEALSMTGMTVRFGGVTALDSVTLSVRPGQVVGLIGPNGSGKTTLLDAVCGLVRADGEVRLGDARIDRMPTLARARRGVARTFQAVELFDDMTVLDNVAVAADHGPAAGRRNRSLPRAAQIIENLGLNAEVGRDPGELPTGRRRLAGIARALAAAPTVVLLDEPAAGLDDAERRELGRLIRRLADEWRLAVLLIEHDVQLVADISDHVVALELGRVIAAGTPATVLKTPAVVAAYLGASHGSHPDASAGADPEPVSP